MSLGSTGSCSRRRLFPSAEMLESTSIGGIVCADGGGEGEAKGTGGRIDFGPTKESIKELLEG